MKRVNDDPYSPDPADDEVIRSRVKCRPVRKPSQRDLREVREAQQAIDQLRRMSNSVSRPRRGRPSDGPTDSFLAFILVNNELRTYRTIFGVKRVPATEVEKFIGYAMRTYPAANESTIRRHLRNDQKLLPSRAGSTT